MRYKSYMYLKRPIYNIFQTLANYIQVWQSVFGTCKLYLEISQHRYIANIKSRPISVLRTQFLAVKAPLLEQVNVKGNLKFKAKRK